MLPLVAPSPFSVALAISRGCCLKEWPPRNYWKSLDVPVGFPVYSHPGALQLLIPLLGFLTEAVSEEGGGCLLAQGIILCACSCVFFLLSQLACTESLPRNHRLPCNCHLLFELAFGHLFQDEYYRPHCIQCRAYCFSSCLSWDFAAAGKPQLMTLSRVGQAVFEELGAPYLLCHWRLIELETVLPKVVEGNFSVFCLTLKGLTPFTSLSSSQMSLSL